MSAMSILDIDGLNLEKDSKRVAYFLDDFFKFCSDRLVVLYNGDTCKLLSFYFGLFNPEVKSHLLI